MCFWRQSPGDHLWPKASEHAYSRRFADEAVKSWACRLFLSNFGGVVLHSNSVMLKTFSVTALFALKPGVSFCLERLLTVMRSERKPILVHCEPPSPHQPGWTPAPNYRHPALSSVTYQDVQGFGELEANYGWVIRQFCTSAISKRTVWLLWLWHCGDPRTALESLSSSQESNSRVQTQTLRVPCEDTAKAEFFLQNGQPSS